MNHWLYIILVCRTADATLGERQPEVPDQYEQTWEKAVRWRRRTPFCSSGLRSNLFKSKVMKKLIIFNEELAIHRTKKRLSKEHWGDGTTVWLMRATHHLSQNICFPLWRSDKSVNWCIKRLLILIFYFNVTQLGLHFEQDWKEKAI